MYGLALEILTRCLGWPVVVLVGRLPVRAAYSLLLVIRLLGGIAPPKQQCSVQALVKDSGRLEVGTYLPQWTMPMLGDLH